MRASPAAEGWGGGRDRNAEHKMQGCCHAVVTHTDRVPRLWPDAKRQIPCSSRFCGEGWLQRLRSRQDKEWLGFSPGGAVVPADTLRGVHVRRGDGDLLPADAGGGGGDGDGHGHRRAGQRGGGRGHSDGIEVERATADEAVLVRGLEVGGANGDVGQGAEGGGVGDEVQPQANVAVLATEPRLVPQKSLGNVKTQTRQTCTNTRNIVFLISGKKHTNNVMFQKKNAN